MATAAATATAARLTATRAADRAAARAAFFSVLVSGLVVLVVPIRSSGGCSSVGGINVGPSNRSNGRFGCGRRAFFHGKN
jgi:hypothetical protein